MFDAVVVGAGVVGASVAYHCAALGMRVCVVEREGLGGRTTSASAGLTIASSRVPGPSLDFALANVRLLGELRETFRHEIDYVQSGSLILAEDSSEYELLRQFVLKQSAHLPVEFLEAGDLQKLEPNLGPRFLGAAYCALDGYANPMGLSIVFARQARAMGAELRVRTEVVGIEMAGGAVAGLRTSSGTIPAANVINAAGVWSPQIARLVGVEIPIVPRKGQLLVSEPIPVLFRRVLSHAGQIPFRDHGITPPDGVTDELHKKRYMKQASGGPFAGRVYVGSTSEFVGFDWASTWQAITELSQYALETVPALAGARLVRSWAGLRPRSLDGKFLIGPVSGLSGFFVATGHDSSGVLHSALTGRLLADWIATGERPPLLAQFDPARAVTRSVGPKIPA